MPIPFDPVRNQKALLNQREALVGALTQFGDPSLCSAEMLSIVAGAKGIGMNSIRLGSR